MQGDNNAIYQMRFPQKLWYLLNLRTDAILWGGTGRTILLNYRILKNYLQCDNSIFKTANISSFVRQLNLYGFRKVTSHLQDPLCNSSNPFMHEYVHDFFQFGRPELLNQITRKALTMKRGCKLKSLYIDELSSIKITPLQKARHALQMALKKAAQDMCINNFPINCQDFQDDSYENEENMELYGLFPDSNGIEKDSSPSTEPNVSLCETTLSQKSNSYSNKAIDALVNDFKDEPCGRNTEADNYPTQFLNMPDLDPMQEEVGHGMELLAEFNIHNDIDQGVVKKIDKIKDDDNGHNSLNCVLPSINSDQNDDVMSEENASEFGHYHGEWDQMLNEMMMSRGSNPECSSDLKELYSQISKTIDVLNS